MLDKQFQKVEDEYFLLNGKLSAGRITREQFDEAMKELMVEHEGRYWVIGGKSGKWHMHDGQNWVEAEPPRAGPANVPAGAAGIPGGAPSAIRPREVRRFEGYSYEIGGHKLSSSDVECVAFSADGRFALAAEQHGVRVWNLETGKLLARIQDYGAKSAVLSASGTHVLTGGIDKIIRLWDVERNQEIRKFEGHADYVMSVAFSPDGQHIFSGGDRTIRRWNVATGREERRFEGHEGAIVNIALTDSGRRVVSMAGDQTVRLWDAESGREFPDMRLQLNDNYDENLAHRVAIHGNLVLTCSAAEDEVGVWDLSTRSKVRDLVGHTGQVWGAAFSADGRLAFTCAGSDYLDEELRARVGLDNLVRVWDVESGAEVGRLEGHDGDVLCLAVSPDGRHVITGSKDLTTRLWAL